MPKIRRRRTHILRWVRVTFFNMRRRGPWPPRPRESSGATTIDQSTQTPIWSDERHESTVEGSRTKAGKRRIYDRIFRNRGREPDDSVDESKHPGDGSSVGPYRSSNVNTEPYTDGEGHNKSQVENPIMTPDEAEKSGNKSFRLLDLPIELRQAVYGRTLPEELDVSQNGVPALLRCSPQISREAAPVCNRVLTIRFWNGYCGPFESKRKMMEDVARRVRELGSRDDEVQIRIELMCRRSSYVVDWHLEPLLEAIRTTRLPRVGVHMAQSQVCEDCVPLHYIDEMPLEKVSNLVAHMETLRDRGFVRAGVYRRSSCQCRYIG